MKRSPKNLKVTFSGEHLTHFGGLYLLQKFLQKVNLRSLLSQYMHFFQRNNRYTTGEEMMALIYPISLGLGRIETTHLLKHNGVFQYLTGLSTYPNPTTLRRFLLRMAPLALPKLRKLHDRLLLAMILKPNPPTKVIFDLDSTVLILYGKQEMARIGYNPKKWGRPSYHPLLCFNGITKDFWQGELRPGDAHTATGTVELLKTVFAKLPPSVKLVIIRADKGFYDHETIEYLESRKALFVIVAKLTGPVKRKISTLSYQVHSSGLETAEFMYQPTKWKKEYRFVVVRRLIPEDSSEQLTLFSMGKYSYQVIVTNMKLTPLNTWRFYNGRAAVELIIKELKGDYPLAKIPTKHFAANEAYFHTLLFSYNLINWFKRLCLPKEFHNMTLKTLRSRLLLIPGELVRAKNRPTLKLPANFLYKDAFEYAIKKIENLRI
ncbi:MAG: IS1380 family transposase [Candidatus Jordarchaeum sp.]|uniref:IS1380 family transposase n=1 Tax=Candidatus Jordarchaeum sp. TaxID=2823881 RepID=UPI004049BADB